MEKVTLIGKVFQGGRECKPGEQIYVTAEQKKNLIERGAVADEVNIEIPANAIDIASLDNPYELHPNSIRAAVKRLTEGLGAEPAPEFVEDLLAETEDKDDLKEAVNTFLAGLGGE